MRIVMIAENDPAGTAAIIREAVTRLADHDCRLITWQRRYVCEFAADLHLPDLAPGSWEQVADVVRAADVVHLHMLADESAWIGPWRLAELVDDKPIVRHHHGHPEFRRRVDEFVARYTGERADDLVLVSTPDMLDLFPPERAEWVANFVPLEDPRYAPTTDDEWSARAGQRLRVCQSPTRRSIKSTDALERVCEELDIELDLIERESHAGVLRRRRLADVVFDQMNYSFGVSSLEAFALGKPVLCRLDAFNRHHIAMVAWCREEDLPWWLVDDEADLRNVLRGLVDDVDRSRIRAAGKAARMFMELRWGEIRFVEQLSEVWRRASARASRARRS